MSTLAGVWSETALRSVRMRADALMLDDRLKKDYEPRIEVLEAIQRVNTANILPLKDGRKNYTVEIMWMNACQIAAKSCTPCAYGGNELSSNTVEYALDQCKEVPFDINHYDHWSNEFGWEEAVAKGMLTAEIRMIEQVVWSYLTAILTHAGVNQWNGDAAIATVVGNETRINPVNYTTGIIGYLSKVANYNQFTNPVMISGDLMANDYFNAQMQAGAFNDNGNSKRFTQFDWFWDIFNFNALGLGLYQFMVQTGATAFASRGIYSPTVEQWGDGTYHWSAPSQFWPELIIDWNMKETCSNDMRIQQFVARSHWGNFINPAGCNEENNGILLFHAL